MTTTPTPERMLPRIPLIYLIILMTVCAVMMGIIHQAVTNREMWAVLMTVVIACLLLPVLIYAGSFAIASLFSTIGQAAVGAPSEHGVHQPTTEMPGVQLPPVVAMKSESQDDIQ